MVKVNYKHEKRQKELDKKKKKDEKLRRKQEKKNVHACGEPGAAEGILTLPVCVTSPRIACPHKIALDSL